jgi:hypothetical protein
MFARAGGVWPVIWSLMLTAACSDITSARVDERHTIEVEDGRAIQLRLSLTGPHATHAPRIVDAARATLTRLHTWLGPFPQETLTLQDIASASDPGGDSAAVISPRWIDPARSRDLEADVTGALTRLHWHGVVDMRQLEPTGLAEGLRLFTQGRVMDDVYGGNRFHAHRFLGGAVPWVVRSIPVRGVDVLDRASSGAPGGHAGDSGLRAARALVTLERYLGWPVLQQALEMFAVRWRSRTPTEHDFFAVMAEASGRDLAWFVTEAFGSARTFDYGIDSLSSANDPSAPDRFLTTVVVRRHGDAVFSGSSVGPEGPFESGRGVQLLVQFASGQQVRDHWDGRDATRRFAYESDTRAAFAHVDPDEILFLDADRTNNVRLTERSSPPAAISRWTWSWAAWLQHAMLAYGSVL